MTVRIWYVKYVQLLSGYFTRVYLRCGFVSFGNSKQQKPSQSYVTKMLVYITAAFSGQNFKYSIGLLLNKKGNTQIKYHRGAFA